MTARLQEFKELRTKTASKLNALVNTAEKLVRRNGNEELIHLISLFGLSLLPRDKVSEFHAKFKR
jgi:phage FluMu protein gp41